MQELARGPLDPAGSGLRFDAISIRSPGIAGNATVSRPSAGETRAQVLASAALASALDHHGIATDYVIEIGGVAEQATRAAVRSRSLAPGHKGIEIRVPAARAGQGQLLLVTDENGIASWHLPLTAAGGVDTSRTGATVTFVIPGYAPQSIQADGSRGFLGWLGKKVVRVLSFAIQDVGAYFARQWEDRNRPYDLRRITSSTYRENGAGRLTAADWQELGGGRSLLLLHGTFSRASSAFWELTPTFIDELNERYSGRVFAFDHKTLSEDPTDNARFFAGSMPNGQVLDVDIVCHSRGGHVARILSEYRDDLPLEGKSLTVNQVVFVASPNRGTVLADPTYFGDLVDAATNVLAALPDNVVTDVLDVVLTLIKQLAVGALEGLEGLASMDPAGDYLNRYLNQGPSTPTLYRAIAANFEPTRPALRPWARDRLMDQVFREPNDLVVPTNGVFEDNGDVMFPIESPHRLELDPAENVHHGSFFSNARVVHQLDAWLTGR